MLKFHALLLVIDILGKKRWTRILSLAGQNALLAFILPAMVQYLAMIVAKPTGVNFYLWLWPYLKTGGAAGILNAIFLTGLLTLLAAGLTRSKIIVKI